MDIPLEEKLALFFAEHDFVLHRKLFDDLVTFIELQVYENNLEHYEVQDGFEAMYG